jgi:hypothetical protein
MSPIGMIVTFHSSCCARIVEMKAATASTRFLASLLDTVARVSDCA